MFNPLPPTERRLNTLTKISQPQMSYRSVWLICRIDVLQPFISFKRNFLLEFNKMLALGTD